MVTKVVRMCFVGGDALTDAEVSKIRRLQDTVRYLARAGLQYSDGILRDAKKLTEVIKHVASERIRDF